MLHRKFAVIKLWPQLKTAEDECIARLKIAAKSLGIECLEVDSFARLKHPPHAQLTQDDVDFVISLHFEQPKHYDIFSFVALWNPVQFFHEWGYRRCTSNLLTHDDFLSCSSTGADAHLERCISNDPMREGPYFRLYHSVSEPLFDPTTGNKKLFYAGINWERLGGKPGRFQELLRLLDKNGNLLIYGPKTHLGENVWAGYKSYVGSVPFDGVSILREINKAGISLVLSSEAHKQSELMSSRLFESLAAGVVIICDENPFARRFFGDTLLYVDTSLPADETYAQVQSHIDWIKSEPAKARELAKQAQEIFRKKFTLDRDLERIYQELPARKEKLEGLYKPKRPQEKITLLFLMPEFQPKVMERLSTSCLAQKNVKIRPVLVMDRRDAEVFGHRVQTRLNELAVPIATEVLDFFERYPNGFVKRRRRVGEVIDEAIKRLAQDDYLCIVSPNEQLFSDHLCSLLRVLQDSEEAGAAWSNVLFSHRSEGQDYADLNYELNFANWDSNHPLGFGRFLFRMSALGPDLQTTLPYLDALSMHLLAGTVKITATKRCTLMLDVQDRFNLQFVDAKRNAEREILIDYAPAVFGKNMKYDVEPISVPDPSLEGMDPERKTEFAVELAHSVPFPASLKKIAFGLYRLWYRSQK